MELRHVELDEDNERVDFVQKRFYPSWMWGLDARNGGETYIGCMYHYMGVSVSAVCIWDLGLGVSFCLGGVHGELNQCWLSLKIL